MADEDLLPIDQQDDWKKALAVLAPRPQMDNRMMQAAPVAQGPPALNMNPTGTPTTPPDTALRIPGNDGLKGNDSALKTPSLSGALTAPDVSTSQPAYQAPAMSNMLRTMGAQPKPQAPQDLEPHGWRKALGLGLLALTGKEAGANADEFLHGGERRAAAAANQKSEQDFRQAQIDNIRSEIANRGGGATQPKVKEILRAADGKEYEVFEDGTVKPAQVGGTQLTGAGAEKPKKFAELSDPKGNRVSGYEQDGQLFLANGTPAPEGYGTYQKPEADEKNKYATLKLPGGQQVAGKEDPQGNLLLADGTPAPKGTIVYQQPNYGQLVLPTKTQNVLVNGIPTEMGWDEKTQRYDIPQGQSATGAYAHEEAQAGAVQRAGEKLITDIQKNKDKLGTLSAWVNKYGLDTPIADPELAGLQSELSTFSALQPAMHGFRSKSAQEAFQKIIGEVQKNPDATIASIRGILKTAGSINPQIQGAGGAPAGSVRLYKDGKAYNIPSDKADDAKKRGYTTER